MHSVRSSLKTLIRVVALAALSLQAGCGGGGYGGSAAHTAQSASAKTPQGLTAMLTEDRAAVGVGGTVTYTLTLTNNTAQAISFQTLHTGSAGDVGGSVQVTDPTGTELGSVGGTLILYSPNVTLAPGQSVSDTVPEGGGDTFAKRGQYTVKAEFTVLSPGAGDSVTHTQTGTLTVDVQ